MLEKSKKQPSFHKLSCYLSTLWKRESIL